MSQIKSSIPSIYNPGSLNKEEIIGSFVIRKKEFKRIYDAVKQDNMQTPGQHYVIQGQRGSGKTTLLLMLKYTIQDDPELNQWLIPVMFNEEQYNITKLYKLWESIAGYLEEEEGSNFFGLEDEMKSHTETGEYESICFDILNSALEKYGKKLLLLIDNFGDMVSKFKTKERQRLREILTVNSNFKIIGGTAVTLIFQANYSHPFFEFFKIISLESLTKEETIHLLKKFGEINQDSEKINKLLNEKPEQVEALRLLTGGVPRTIALLYEIFVDSESGESFKDLEILIDRVTPLYKDKLDDMPPSQQEIIDALALNWDAMTVKEIAAATRMKSKEISVHINRMVKDNIVLKIDTSTKNYLYIIQERFLNIWYLMRYGNKRSENRVKWLTQFLECWLNEEEIVGFGEKLKSIMQTGRPYAKYALYMTSAIAETKAYVKEKDNLIEAAKTYLLKADPSLIHELPGTDNDLFNEAAAQYKKENYTSAAYKLQKIKNKTIEVYFNLGLCFENSKDFKKAEEYYLIAINMKHVNAMFNLALLYENEFKNFKKAEEYYIMAVKKGHADAMFNLALMYEDEFKDFKKAEEYYIIAVEKGHADAMFNLALLYQDEFKDVNKAEEYYIMAVDKGYTAAIFNLALMYKNEFKDLKKAEEYYVMAVEKGDADAMNNLALMYKNELNNVNGAIELLGKASKLGNIKAKMNLALTYFNEKKSKINFTNLANELRYNEEAKKDYGILIDMITVNSLLWENKADEAIEMIEKTNVRLLFFAGDVNEAAFDLLLLLLAKKQYNYVQNLFKDNDLNLKDKLKPIYYAVMYLLKDEFPDEYKKMGSELKPVFDDILKKIKEMEIKYA